MSTEFDVSESANVALFYGGILPDEAQVKVLVESSDKDIFIEQKFLQWGYKLYGEGYNLIDELNDDCVD